ncbi:hypothetical protein [Leptolyngbya sp. KIOST-1]|uniref:hypothetical protein n=1 Tax=Leptolyngbya sp. KIOST-1 TaxID=1229172 RepID=UPI0005613462|nr:hypothetical protein [Leptolyngbya sp. KIOST-1]
MFEYLEPDAAGAPNQPPAQPSQAHPQPEKLRHLLYGSRAAIDRTIKILHSFGYADPNDWSDPIPAPQGNPAAKPDQWMAILIRTVLLE